MSGFIVARSLNPSQTACPFKYGHPYPLLRSYTLACHSKSKCFPVLGSSYGNIHQTFFLELTATSVGLRLPFFVRCHCLAKSGLTDARSLNPFHTDWPLRNGHPRFLLLRSFIYKSTENPIRRNNNIPCYVVGWG